MKKTLQNRSQTSLKRDGLIHSEVSISEIPMWQLPGKGKVGPSNTSKIVTRVMDIAGRQMKVPIEILPSAKWGYPTVLDLEYFRAFERALTIFSERDGFVPDVIQISGRELIKLTGREPNGDRQKEVRAFIDRFSTLVLKEYRSDKKGRRAETGVHIFERIDRAEVPSDEPGREEWAHQIRLADWYWANLNNFHCHVQDQRLFWSLQRDLTKLLYQHLHALFRHGHGMASELYSELATNLSLKRWGPISLVRRQLKPAHDELLNKGFIGSWHLDSAELGKHDYLVRWEAGPAWQEVYIKEQERLKAIERGPIREAIAHQSLQDHVVSSDGSPNHEDLALALKEIYDFVGHTDVAYEPFWKKVIESFSRSIRHRVMGEVRELALSRRIRTTRARALVSAFQREGKKQRLPGWEGRPKTSLLAATEER